MSPCIIPDKVFTTLQEIEANVFLKSLGTPESKKDGKIGKISLAAVPNASTNDKAKHLTTSTSVKNPYIKESKNSVLSSRQAVKSSNKS